jgi:hypothetical protein
MPWDRTKTPTENKTGIVKPIHIMASTVCDSLCGTSAHISPKAQANGSLLGPGVLAVQYREGSIATMWVFRTATVSRWRWKPNGHRLTPKKGSHDAVSATSTSRLSCCRGACTHLSSGVCHVYQDLVCSSGSSYATHNYWSFILVDHWHRRDFDEVVWMAGLRMTRSCRFLAMIYYIQNDHRSMQSPLSNPY